jgi:chromosome segregation ATPase
LPKAILAVDTLTFQRSLTVLEDRYRELREVSQRRFTVLESERDAALQGAAELQQQLSDQADATQRARLDSEAKTTLVQALQDELANLTGEREALASTMETTLRTVENLERQLKDQANATQQAQLALDNAVSQLRSLEGEAVLMQDLQAQLQDAREDSELLLQQLHQAQEELEHYYLLSLQQPHPVVRMRPQPRQSQHLETDAINAFRQHLLTSH